LCGLLIATNGTTSVTDNSQLAVFIHGVNKDLQLVVEGLELVRMKRKTSADEVFSDFVTPFSKYKQPGGKPPTEHISTLMQL
jgi:hypothetical protein